MWAAGLCLVAAVVARWGIVGPGFLWLIGGLGFGVGIAAGLASPWGVGGLACAAAGVVLAQRPSIAAVAFGAAGAAFLTVAILGDSLLPALTGTLALGGITGEMLLGHWYLVDPRLPRWALRRLDAAGAAGVVADMAVAAVRGTLRAPTDMFGAALAGLGGLTLVLAAGVWFSLREKGYAGVMAATGLSYLATLTVLAVVFLARTGSLGLG